jgi:hypothetical protein
MLNSFVLSSFQVSGSASLKITPLVIGIVENSQKEETLSALDDKLLLSAASEGTVSNGKNRAFVFYNILIYNLIHFYREILRYPVR